MTRKRLVAGNWKLNLTVAESTELARGVLHRVAPWVTGKHSKAHPDTAVDVVIAPVFTALFPVFQDLSGTPGLSLAGQDMFWEDAGAFTGEVSAAQLKDAGCSYVIVGHSERRQHFGERDEHVKRKVGAALNQGLCPIICIGETLAERERGDTEPVVLRQLDAVLSVLGDEHPPIVIAYEPVWAIGTGRTAQPGDAQAVHAAIRQRLASTLGPNTAAGTRLLYGGSVKPGNASALMAENDIDGALVGGASLQPDSFAAIVEAAVGA